MNFTNADKQALIDNTATIPFKINIIQDGSIVRTLDETNIVNIDYEDFRYVDSDSLIVGQFVARKITGSLDRIDTDFEIEDTELELQMGVSYGETTNYYSLGNFLVTKPTNDDVKEKTTFEALDYTKKFNKIFDGSTIVYPCTALQLAQECCRQAGVILETTDFTNYDFVVMNDQYVENDTCRKVMQDIGKLAYSWVRIGVDNKCYIDFSISNTVDQYDVITNNNYYDLSLQKEVFGPVNRVVIGMRDVEGENVVIDDTQSIIQNGLTELKIYDNNLTYTPELREQVKNSASRLFGLTYTPLEVNTTGHPWLIGKEKIQINDMNDNPLYTYPWDRTIAYNGHIKSKITSKADTKTETEYKNYGNIENAVNKTRIIVDKQNQTIEALAEQVQPISDTKIGNGSITLENAYEGTLHYLEITGDIKLVYPRNDLYPKNDLYPLGTTLLVDEDRYDLGFNFLGYYSSVYCDKFICEDGKCWIERNTYIDTNGVVQPLSPMVKEELNDIAIQVKSNSVISLAGFNTARLSATYLLQNDYTNTFATNVDIISKINLAPGTVQINASKKIALEGYTTINGNFAIDLNGNMYARNGTFEGNIYLPNGGKVIGGDGLFSCLMYSSTGRWADWEILGYGCSSTDALDTTVKYCNVYMNVYIPNNFVITEAYAVLQTSSVKTAYSSSSGDFETVGSPKELGLFKGDIGSTVQFFYYPYQAVDEYVDYDGTEITNAFTTGRYTPTIPNIGDVVTVISKDIKDYLTVGELNPIFIKSMITPKPTISTFTPSGASYQVLNYKNVVENTGIGKLNLYVFGYMGMEENNEET